MWDSLVWVSPTFSVCVQITNCSYIKPNTKSLDANGKYMAGQRLLCCDIDKHMLCIISKSACKCHSSWILVLLYMMHPCISGSWPFKWMCGIQLHLHYSWTFDPWIWRQHLALECWWPLPSTAASHPRTWKSLITLLRKPKKFTCLCHCSV